MRPAPFLAVFGALAVQAKTVLVTESGQTETVTACEPQTPSTWPTSPGESTPVPSASGNESSTATVTTTSTEPNESATDGPDTTAGAISQPMKSSVCGLLGFLIVGLVML